MQIRRQVVLWLDGIILLNVVCCLAKDVCYYSNNNYEVYCEDGYYCCRDNTRCCAEGISTGAIIGITLAAIFVLAFCVAGAMIIAKKNKAPGRRIHQSSCRPNNVHNIQNIAVINPPPYGQHSAPPPNYTPSAENYFVPYYQQAPPPYTASAPPPPAYSAPDQHPTNT